MSPGPRDAWLRGLLAALPLLAVAVVGWAFIETLRPGRVLAARIYGGPAAGAGELSLLVELVAASAGSASTSAGAQAFELQLTHAGRSVHLRETSDAQGLREVRLPFAEPSAAEAQLEVRSPLSPVPLARGPLRPNTDAWHNAPRAGGWIEGQARGDLAIRVAVAAGTFAVPFEGTLQVAVTHASAPAPGATLSLTLDGAELAADEPLLTDAEGNLSVVVRPDEHAIALDLRALTPDGAQGSWYGALPVVPGALEASLVAGRLRVRSPIVRERAFVSFVNESGRLGGAILALVPTAEGFAVGELALERELPAPLWAVVSSEPDKRSPGAVGWPLQSSGAPAPRGTFTPYDQLLADGLGAARAADLERRRRTRAHAAIAAGALGLVEVLLFAYAVLGRARRPAGALAEGDAALEHSLRINPWLVAVALACLGLGILALLLFGTRGPP